MGRILSLSLLVFGALAVAAFKLLPWWAGVGLILIVPVVLGKLAMRGIRRLALQAFAAKGAVLRGATAKLLAITRAEPPKPDFDDAFEAVDGDDCEGEDEIEASTRVPSHFAYIDVTVTPAALRSDSDAAEASPFQHWDPNELSLVQPDAKGGVPQGDADADDVAELLGAELWSDGQWVVLEGAVEGEARVRLHVAVHAATDVFRFQYYFELLRAEASPH